MTTTQELPAQEREALNRHNRIVQRLAWLEQGTGIDVAEFAADVRAALAAQVEPQPLSDEEIDAIAAPVVRSELLVTEWREFARAIESAAIARAAVPAVPEGWKLVPVEPTRQMQLAAHAATLASYDFMDRGVVPAVYRAMIAAAPQAEARQEQPKQPDSVYLTSSSGEAATARDAAESALRLAEIGLANAASYEGRSMPTHEVESVKTALAAVRAALSSTPAQGDGGTGGVAPSDGGQKNG